MQRSRIVIPVLFAAVVFGSSLQPAWAQGTYTGSTSPNAIQYYRFTPSSFGQLTATLSWDSEPSTLIMVVACGTDTPVIYGAAAGRLDRTARFESGLIGLNPCVLGVSTTNSSPAANYRLNLQLSSTQVATPQTSTLNGVTAVSTTPVDATLVESTNEALAAMRARIR